MWKDGFYGHGINCTSKNLAVALFGLMNLVHLVETIQISSDIGNLAQVTLYDLHGRQ